LPNEKSFIANLISNPTSFSILVLSAVILIVWLDQRQPQTMSNAASSVSVTQAKTMDPDQSDSKSTITLKPPSFNAGNTPKILNTMGDNKQPGKLQAPDLGGLLAGLEAKVAADPSNIGKRLLLAQTYNELGMVDKSLTELRKLQTEEPENNRVNLVLSSVLSKSDNEKDLKESLQILDKLVDDKSVKQYLVQLYRGNALIRQQNHEGALKSWQAALETMPEADNRRAILQQRVAELSQKENSNNKNSDTKSPN
jgi:tetratricopeptide (TPR) repeat protein